MTGTRENPEREQSLSIFSNVSSRSMQIMSVRGTMISRVSVSESVSTLRSISETSGSKSLASTRRSMVARPLPRRFAPFCPPIFANGVNRTAMETASTCCSIMSTGLDAPALRGRTNSEITAMTMAKTNPASNSAHSGASNMPAITVTSTPSTTLQQMRKNAHDPAVA